MKKLLGIVVLGLLWPSLVNATTYAVEFTESSLYADFTIEVSTSSLYADRDICIKNPDSLPEWFLEMLD